MNEIMTAKEVSTEFNISIVSLQSKVRRKDLGLKAYKRGNRIYFKRSEIEDWERHRKENDGRRYNGGKVYGIKIIIPTSMSVEEAFKHLYDKDRYVIKTVYGFKIKAND